MVGSWRLVSYEDRPDSGTSLFPYGTIPKGLLIYDVAGRMSIQIMKQPHPKVASGNETVTPQEKQSLFDASIACFGTYSVDAVRGVVVHHVEGDLWDIDIGKDEERRFELSGDRLTLKPRGTEDGKQWLGVRVFERLPGKPGGASRPGT